MSIVATSEYTGES